MSAQPSDPRTHRSPSGRTGDAIDGEPACERLGLSRPRISSWRTDTHWHLKLAGVHVIWLVIFVLVAVVFALVRWRSNKALQRRPSMEPTDLWSWYQGSRFRSDPFATQDEFGQMLDAYRRRHSACRLSSLPENKVVELGKHERTPMAAR